MSRQNSIRDGRRRKPDQVSGRGMSPSPKRALELRHAPFQHGAALERPGLVAGPGADPRAARARGVVGIRFRRRHQLRPRPPRARCGAATSSGSRARRGGWRAAPRPCGFRGWCRRRSRRRRLPVDALQQHHARRGAAVRRRGGEAARRSDRSARTFRLRHPGLEGRRRVGGVHGARVRCRALRAGHSGDARPCPGCRHVPPPPALRNRQRLSRNHARSAARSRPHRHAHGRQARPRDGRRQRPLHRLGHRARGGGAGRRGRLHLPGRGAGEARAPAGGEHRRPTRAALRRDRRRQRGRRLRGAGARLGRDGLPGPRHRLRRQAVPARPLPRHAARRLSPGARHLLLFLRLGEPARGAADAARRVAADHELSRRRARHAALQRHGRGQGGAGGERALPRGRPRQQPASG